MITLIYEFTVELYAWQLEAHKETHRLRADGGGHRWEGGSQHMKGRY